MPCGTRIAASTTPATRSERSHPRWYVLNARMPGTLRRAPTARWASMVRDLSTQLRAVCRRAPTPGVRSLTTRSGDGQVARTRVFRMANSWTVRMPCSRSSASCRSCAHMSSVSSAAGRAGLLAQSDSAVGYIISIADTSCVRTGLIVSPQVRMVGKGGFEPPTPCSQSRCATRLRHFPEVGVSVSPRRRSAGSLGCGLGESLGGPADRFDLAADRGRRARRRCRTAPGSAAT